jgi:hypothetical protein
MVERATRFVVIDRYTELVIILAYTFLSGLDPVQFPAEVVSATVLLHSRPC